MFYSNATKTPQNEAAWTMPVSKPSKAYSGGRAECGVPEGERVHLPCPAFAVPNRTCFYTFSYFYPPKRGNEKMKTLLVNARPVLRP